MLPRRQFLAGATGLAAAPQVVRAAGPQTLRIGYLLSIDSQLGAGATAMADELARRTGGRFQIKQFPDASLGG